MKRKGACVSLCVCVCVYSSEKESRKRRGICSSHVLRQLCVYIIPRCVHVLTVLACADGMSPPSDMIPIYICMYVWDMVVVKKNSVHNGTQVPFQLPPPVLELSTKLPSFAGVA